MIRYGRAICPCCVRQLCYNFTSDYFWCDCDGWSHLSFFDRQKELTAAELCDSRSEVNRSLRTAYIMRDGDKNGEK